MEEFINCTYRTVSLFSKETKLIGEREKGQTLKLKELAHRIVKASKSKLHRGSIKPGSSGKVSMLQS
jgi:hypothetical protein